MKIENERIFYDVGDTVYRALVYPPVLEETIIPSVIFQVGTVTKAGEVRAWVEYREGDTNIKTHTPQGQPREGSGAAEWQASKRAAMAVLIDRVVARRKTAETHYRLAVKAEDVVFKFWDFNFAD